MSPHNKNNDLARATLTSSAALPKCGVGWAPWISSCLADNSRELASGMCTGGAEWERVVLRSGGQTGIAYSGGATTFARLCAQTRCADPSPTQTHRKPGQTDRVRRREAQCFRCRLSQGT